MKLRSVVLGLLTLLGVTCVQTEECNNDKKNASLSLLKKHLFCEYDRMVRPALHHSNVTTVYFGIIPIRVEFDEYDNTFDVHGWTLLIWSDAYITWEPLTFGKIFAMDVMSDDLWVPDIYLHNAGNSGAQRMPNTNCWVSHMGLVKCVPVSRYTTLCSSDHTWWPFETYNCSLVFKSWFHSRDEIRIQWVNAERFTDRNYRLSGHSMSNEWNVMDMHVTNHTEPFKLDKDSSSQTVVMYFILKKHSAMVHAIYIVPAIVLMIMTLTTVWLDPKSTERSIIANLNFVSHLLCIFDLDMLIPQNGRNIPNMHKFYEVSLALAAFTLIITSVLRHLQETTTAAPAWISTATSQILRSRFGQILLLSILDPTISADLEVDADDNADLVNSKKKKSGWNYAVILIGWIAFFVALFVYVIMLCTIFPTDMTKSSLDANIKPVNST